MSCPSYGAGTVGSVQLSDYQHRSRVTAVYPNAGDNLTYPALGLCGEAGECAEKVKKAIRDDGGMLTEERRAALAAELGDVLWYWPSSPPRRGWSSTRSQRTTSRSSSRARTAACSRAAATPAEPG